MTVPLNDVIPLAQTGESLSVDGVDLDLLMDAYLDGLSIESLLARHPTLREADLYLALGWTLKHIAAYCQQRQQRADEGNRRRAALWRA